MRISWATGLFSCALLLSGCSGAPVATTTETGPVPGAAFKGMVHGGEQPIVGAHVYLYAVNDTGYAGPGIAASSSNAAVSLLTSASNTTQDGSGNYYVTTGSEGSFSVTGDYTCPTATPYLYVLAVGGNPGPGTNSAITLAAGLGPCTASGFSSLYVVVNEVSTVAAAYAGAGFATDATHVSSSGSTLAKKGVENAYAAIVNLETLNTGVANATSLGGNGTVPQGEINTLANILAACVNSTGPSSTGCTTLFSNAMNGGTAPTDTATAALNIAHNPGANIANLFGLQTASSPFQPDLSSAPNDFTIAINYTGGGLDGPYGIAVDASGNIWAANQTGDSVSKFSPIGSVISPSMNGYASGGFNFPLGIAIDSSGNVWATNFGSDSISEISSGGTANPSSPFSGGGLSSPYGIAFDASGHIWIANSGNSSISEFSSGGSAITTSSGITTGGLDDPVDVALDASGNLWVSNDNGNSISEFDSGGTANLSSPFSGGGLNAPGGIALDTSGNIWTANSGNNSISKFSSGGSPDSGSSGYIGGGLNNPLGLATDGSGNVWVANNSGNSISEFNSIGTNISGSSGYKGGLSEPVDVAIDGSGNVWVTSLSPSTVTEFVGTATPVVTPAVANLLSPYGSHAVNKP